MDLATDLWDTFESETRGSFLDFFLSLGLEFLGKFEFAGISTTNVCNRECIYCPVGDNSRNPKRMPESLFRKIMDDLSDESFRGWVGFNRFSEPLLDERLEDLMQLAKRKNPETTLVIYSNGDYLTPERFEELIESGVSQVRVTDHPVIEDGEPMFEAWEEKPFSEILDRKELSFRRLDLSGGLSNRGGLLDLDNSQRMHKLCCPDPSLSLQIDCEGNVLFCCHQFSAEVGPSFGNLKDMQLSEIWNSSEFKKARKDLRRGNFVYEMCRNCREGSLDV